MGNAPGTPEQHAAAAQLLDQNPVAGGESVRAVESVLRNTGLTANDVAPLIASSQVSMTDIMPFLTVLSNPTQENIASLNPDHVRRVVLAATGVNLPVQSVKEILQDTTPATIVNALRKNPQAVEQLRKKVFEFQKRLAATRPSSAMSSAGHTPTSPQFASSSLDQSLMTDIRH